MKIDTLKKLYVHELKDLYSAENQILDALPKMIEAAADDDLRNAFEKHRKETEDQVRRLEKIFRGLEFEPGGHKCAGMEGLLEEGDEVIKEIDVPEVRDALIAATALVHDLTLVTRNLADFKPTGVEVLDPWA